MNNLITKNEEWINSVWGKIEKKMEKVAVRSFDKLPYTTSDGVHDDRSKDDPGWWTNGFWGGMMWLMYLSTKNDVYMSTAIRSEEKLDEVLKNFLRIDHDAGFMWHLTSGANYRITGDKKAFNTNMTVAAALASRYNIDAGYIRAWNFENTEGISIIDCMMNLPLLYWASEEIGDDRYKKIAMAHADMAIKDHIRPDGSVNHIVRHDDDTGEIIEIQAGQGYSETSCWTRGLAWAIYGSVISYVHTKEKRYLDAAIKCANFFIANVIRTDYLPPIDFRSPVEPLYYDSTAGACVASALLELAKFVSEAEAENYRDASIKMLRAIDEKCANYDENIDHLVDLGSERYPSAEFKRKVVEFPIIYADYYYIEAICKLRGLDFFMW